jgi:hypothetical protein
MFYIEERVYTSNCYQQLLALCVSPAACDLKQPLQVEVGGRGTSALVV